MADFDSERVDDYWRTVQSESMKACGAASSRKSRAAIAQIRVVPPRAGSS